MTPPEIRRDLIALSISPINPQAVASLLGDDSDNEDDELPLSKRAVKLAGKAAVGLYGAVRTSIKSAVTRVGGGDDSMRPLLAASARGAEVAVASGGTVRTFRDEDDFERLLGAFEAPAPSTSRPAGTRSKEDADERRRHPDRRVTHASWAADGSALALATLGGDVHVITRVGRLLVTQPAASRPRGARGCPAGVALAAAASGSHELLVLAGGDGNGGALHVQRVHDPTLNDHIAAQAREGGGSNGAGFERGRVRTVRLAGAGDGTGPRVARAQGCAWNERRRILAVAGDAPSSRTNGGGGPGTQPAQRTPIAASSCAVGLWRYGGGGGGDGEIPVPIAVVAASPAPAPGLSVGAALDFLTRTLGVSPARCHVSMRTGEEAGDDEDLDLDLAVVEPHGTLRVWRLPSGGSNLEPVKLAGDDDWSGDRRVCSVTWWSKGRLAVARHDGDVVVASVPDMSNALGEEPEAFDGSPALVTCPRVTDEGTSERVVVLETPPPETVGAHRWRLATLNARSPREMLRAHLDAEEWGVATQLARLHGLDPDEVHKARWLASPPGKEALNDALSKVTDRAWAAAQCAAAVASTYEQQRFVLVYGLKETERRCERNAEDETDVKWNWWTRLRLTLLAQLDRLDTLNAVHLGNHAPRAWASFRSETIGDAAVGFATAGNPRAAETILRRHPRAGGPSLLDALEALPETMSPSEYPGLMPWAQPWCGTDAPTSTRGARVPDWVEGSAAFTALAQEEADGASDPRRWDGISAAALAVKEAHPSAAWLAVATEEMARCGGAPWQPAAASVEGGAAAWASARARRMDDLAGAVGPAAELLAAASSALGAHDDGISLEAQARAAAELAAAVYEADPPDPTSRGDSAAHGSPSLWSAPLAAYVDASVPERLASLLGDARTAPERVAGALATSAVAAVLADEGGGAALLQWIGDVAASGRVDVVAAAIEASSRHGDASLDALGGYDGLAKAAAAAVEACPSGDAATAASLGAMLEALPPQAADTPGARSAVANVAACRVMAARGIVATPGEIAAAAKDAGASRDFVKRVTARAVREASGAKFSDGGSSWSRKLWSDLAALASPHGALSAHFSREDAAAELLRAQLRVGGGAERSVSARRALQNLFGGGGSGDSDIGVGAAVGVVAGSAAGELVSVAGTVAGAVAGRAVGALGAAVKDARAGNIKGAVTHGAGGALGALGGLVGGLGAAAAELGGHAAGHLAGSSLAGSHLADWLPPALPARVAEGVVAEVASEHLFSAASPDDAGVARAEAVLNCVPNRGRRNEEDETDDGVCALRDVVAAVRQLVTFGVDLAPVTVRQTANRFDIVERCLSEREDAYLREGELQELAARLGLRGTRASHEVSAACARAAMQGGDRAFATAIALRLAAASFSPSWDVAAAVAEAADATDATGGDGTWRPPGMDARAGLLSFALARCSTERAPDLLASWQQLEAARLVANAGVEPPRFADGAGGPLDDAARAALVRAAPTLTQAHAARPRPRLRALAAGPLPSLLAAATSGGEDDRARDVRRAAATALAYSLCLQDVAASDEILAPLAVNAAVASAVDAPPEEPLDDMRVPSWAGPALGLLVGLDSPDSVGKCVDALSVAKGVDIKAVLALGARAHDMRAGMIGDAAAEREGSRRCKSKLRALADADWLARRLGATLVDPGRFVADESGYRARSIVALAALTPTTELPATAIRLRAFELAELYGADRVAVAVAHAGGLLASGAVADLEAARSELVHGAFAEAPDRAIAGLRSDVWPALPTDDGKNEYAAYFNLLRATHEVLAKENVEENERERHSVAAARASAAANASVALCDAAQGCGLSLAALMGPDGGAPSGGRVEATRAVGNSVVKTAHSSIPVVFPSDAVAALAAAVAVLPDPAPGFDSDAVWLSAVCAVLSLSVPGSARAQPHERWTAAETALPTLPPDDIAEVVRWCALGGGHPLGWTDAQGGGGGGFASEASLPLRIRALAAGVEALERAEVSHAELTAFRRSLARLHVVAVVRDAMPSLVADSLRMLDDDAFILAAVAERWVAAGEPLRHVAGLVAAGRKHTGHEGGDADHVDACAKALNAATRAAATAFDGSAGSADARTAAVHTLRAVVVRSLGDDARGADSPALNSLLGSEYPSTLEKARSSAFVELQTFADESSGAPRGARGAALELLGEVAGGDGSSAWPGWRPPGEDEEEDAVHTDTGLPGGNNGGAITAPHGSSSAARLLAMRTAAAVAILAAGVEISESAVADADAAGACFRALLDATPDDRMAAASPTLSQVLVLWEKSARWAAPSSAAPRPMHAQWHALIHRGLAAGAADAALDAIAAAAIDEDVHAVSEEEEEEDEEDDDDDGWGEWGDEGKSEAKTAQAEKRSRSVTGAVVSETEARSLVVAAKTAGPVAAAKVALALPYPSLRPDALAALGNVSGTVLDDDLIDLILRAEVIPSLLSAPALYASVCAAVQRGAEAATVKTPYAVASLAAARCHAAAGTLAMSAAGLHPALVTNDAGVAVLERYLRAHGKRNWDDGGIGGGGSEAARANRRAVRGKCADGLKALLADLR